MPQPRVITPAEAARVKGCTRQAIHGALSRGRLTEYRTGHVRLVVLDALFDAYAVRETGGRAHRSFVAGTGATAPTDAAPGDGAEV